MVFHLIAEDGTKFVPLTVRVKAAPPTAVESGSRPVRVGTGLLTVKETTELTPPPGVGLKTLTPKTPYKPILLETTVADNWVALIYVVARSAPAQRTTEEGTNFVPVTVRVKPAPPAVAEDGLRLVRVGTGFVIANTRAEVTPPPGVRLKTVIAAVPALAILAASILAVSFVALTQVVARSAPFQRITERLTNLVPLTVKMMAVFPAVVEVGLRLVRVGRGLLIVKVSADVSPPPGVGFTTVTFALPAVAIFAASMLAVSWVTLFRVVVRAIPFQWIATFGTKLAPLTVRVNTEPPAVAEEGIRVVKLGGGLMIVNKNAGEVPPPGVGL